MFIQNKYTKCYYNIIYKARLRNLPNNVYTEKHHIIPRSLGGNNSKLNLVKLTAKEHFICHLLLTKMLNGKLKYKMIFALNRMLHSPTKISRYTPSSRFYVLIRKYRSEAISAVHKNVPESKESNQKRSATQKGIPKGPKTEEHKKKISLSKKGKPSRNKGGTTCLKGLTYEEIHGIEKAIQLKECRSAKLKNRQFSEKTKQLWSTNRKGKNTGGDNSNAKPISIDGIVYSSKKEACQKLNLSLYKLSKLANVIILLPTLKQT